MSSRARSGSSAGRWRLRRDQDTRPYYEASILFQAADMDEAEKLFDAMVDGLGCGEGVCDEETPCPHFRVGGLHQLDEMDGAS